MQSTVLGVGGHELPEQPRLEETKPETPSSSPEPVFSQEPERSFPLGGPGEETGPLWPQLERLESGAGVSRGAARLGRPVGGHPQPARSMEARAQRPAGRSLDLC